MEDFERHIYFVHPDLLQCGPWARVFVHKVKDSGCKDLYKFLFDFPQFCRF
jgi:hypothetical protein